MTTITCNVLLWGKYRKRDVVCSPGKVQVCKCGSTKPQRTWKVKKSGFQVNNSGSSRVELERTGFMKRDYWFQVCDGGSSQSAIASALTGSIPGMGDVELVATPTPPAAPSGNSSPAPPAPSHPLHTFMATTGNPGPARDYLQLWDDGDWMDVRVVVQEGPAGTSSWMLVVEQGDGTDPDGFIISIDLSNSRLAFEPEAALDSSNRVNAGNGVLGMFSICWPDGFAHTPDKTTPWGDFMTFRPRPAGSTPASGMTALVWATFLTISPGPSVANWMVLNNGTLNGTTFTPCEFNSMRWNNTHDLNWYADVPSNPQGPLGFPYVKISTQPPAAGSDVETVTVNNLIWLNSPNQTPVNFPNLVGRFFWNGAVVYSSAFLQAQLVVYDQTLATWTADFAGNTSMAVVGSKGKRRSSSSKKKRS